VAWVRRGHEAAPTPVAPDEGDSPESLRRRISQAVTFINRSSGQLPGTAVVAARRLTDVLSEVVDTSSIRPLDVYVVINVRKTLEDYLPTSLRSYLALTEDARTTPGPTGTTPAQGLVEQIEALLTSASSALAATRSQDMDAMLAQGAFLRTKFSGSDLDL
jgi:hypothetical protein